ncbi:MAG: hypothetical protein R6V53_01605 [Candidatus Woesearchaeota archaeon]
MKRTKFIHKHLDNLLEDYDINKYFEENPHRYDELMDGLRDSLGKAYDSYAKSYFEEKGLGSYVSNFLRKSGFVADTLATYTFWTMGGAMALKPVGFGLKTIADGIEGTHYARHVKKGELSDHLTDDLSIAGEGLLERVVSYLPLGVGEVADVMRGTKKYDTRIVNQALGASKREFIKQFGEYKPQGQIIPLDEFRNPQYNDLISDYRKAA